MCRAIKAAEGTIRYNLMADPHTKNKMTIGNLA